MTWIDINERKPEEGQAVLKFCWSIKDAKPVILVGEVGETCTHWMPLPEPPKKIRWTPKDGEEWFSIKLNGELIHFISTAPLMGYQLTNDWKFLGVYRTREEAKIMRDKIARFVSDEIGEVE